MWKPLLLVGLCGSAMLRFACSNPHGVPETVFVAVIDANAVRVLGERLFFDRLLSEDYSVSCASCHRPDFGFSEPVPVRMGGNGAFPRNTPSLWNVAFRKRLNRDGGVLHLEDQALGPLQGKNELGLNLGEAVMRLQNDTSYIELFYEAFGTVPEVKGIVHALSEFQRSLRAPVAPVQLWFFGEWKGSPAFLEGGREFAKAGCASCHRPPLFGSDAFARVLPVDSIQDHGRYRISGITKELGAFLISPLRGIPFTAPYFHDGRYGNLFDAIWWGHSAIYQDLDSTRVQSIADFLTHL